MAIQFDKEKNIFTLESKNTAYQIMIGDYGVLQHLYYGKRVGKCDMSYLVQMYDRGFSGQIPDAGNRREFSMDTLLQEGMEDMVLTFVMNRIRFTRENIVFAGFLQCMRKKRKRIH